MGFYNSLSTVQLLWRNMSKMNFNKQLINVLCGLGICLSANGMCVDAVPGPTASGPTALTVTPPDDCLLSFYPTEFVNVTLDRNKVPKEEWVAINKELASKDILGIMESKASKMNPNPLEDPSQRQASVTLFRQTLFDNFAVVMKAHGIKDDKQIQTMLDDIQQQKAKNFAKCVENHKKMTPVQAPSVAPANLKKEVQGSTGAELTPVVIPASPSVE